MFLSTMEWRRFATPRRQFNSLGGVELKSKKGLEAKVSTCRTHDETARRATKEGDNSLQDLCHKSFRTGTPFLFSNHGGSHAPRPPTLENSSFLSGGLADTTQHMPMLVKGECATTHLIKKNLNCFCTLLCPSVEFTSKSTA